MSTPTLYLDCLILVSAIHPSGFSQSLFTLRRASPDEVSAAFLRVLALPYLAVTVAVWSLRPELLSFHGASAPWFAAAVLLAPVALGLEYGLHAVASYRVSGSFPHGITVPRFWRRQLAWTDHLLLVVIAVGEEVLFRRLWLDALQGSFGLPALAALAASSLAYGLNHLAFGATSVLAKSVTGLLYGGLYLLGGRSLWLPVTAHVLQNLLLFGLARDGDE